MDPEITVEQLMQIAERQFTGDNLEEVQGLLDQAAKTLGLGSGPGGGLGEAFKLRLEAREGAARGEAIARVAERGRVSAGVQTILNTLSFGQMGSLIDRFGPEGTSGEEFRRGMQDVRLAQPIPTAATELATGAAIGGPALAARSGLLARMGLGGVAGGTVSGLFGFGEAAGTLPERIEEGARSVGPGMAFGALTGAFIRPTVRTAQVGGRAVRGRRAANIRLGRELQEKAGVTRDINPQLARAQAETERVSREFFQPLDEAFPQVTDPDVLEFLDFARETPEMRGPLRAIAPEVARDQRPISFSELQDFRDRLWKKGSATKDSGDELQSIMEEVFPGFREGNAQFRAAKDIEDAFLLGSGEMNSTFRGVKIKVDRADRLERALAELPPESHEAFRTGLLQRTINRISRPERGAASQVELLRELIDDVDTNGKLRDLFPNDRLAEEFMSLVRQEVSARILRKALIRAGIIGAGGLLLGGAAAVGASLAGER